MTTAMMIIDNYVGHIQLHVGRYTVTLYCDIILYFLLINLKNSQSRIFIKIGKQIGTKCYNVCNHLSMILYIYIYIYTLNGVHFRQVYIYNSIYLFLYTLYIYTRKQ